MRKLALFIIVHTAVLLLCSLTVTAQEPSQELKAAIIIDDFGGGIGGVREFLEGDVPITAAVMPFTETSTEHATLAHKNGLEVMIHLPMQPKKGKKSWLPPHSITNDLSPEEVKERVREAIQSVPYAKGLNNHMGSLVVENEPIVRAIVEVVQEHNMFIVDSGTSMQSKFPEIAEQLGVPILKRDVFLDDISSIRHVKKQMHKLAKITQEKGMGIAIGHVGVKGKVSAEAIFESMPYFKKRDIQVVHVSELISQEIQQKYFNIE